MPQASVKRLIECDKNQLIDLVLDIEKYPTFIPYCLNSKIYKKEDSLKNIDLIKDYSKHISAPYSFTNVPGEIHRVFSLEDYTAYEVSTPELDDVIRISDDNSRKSGRILKEHKV